MRRTVRWALAAATAFSAAMSVATPSQALSQAQEAADCQGDALRLCSPYIPDHAKIHTCLVTYKAYLSPASRSIIAPAKQRR